MRPIAFELGPLSIHWYGICAATGFLLAIWLLHRNRVIANLKAEQIADLGFYVLIAGIIGARLFYVIQFWDQFRGNLFDVIKIHQGGLVFYGGFLAALLVLWWYCRRHNLQFLRIIDVFSPSLALAHAVGRVGCFFQGCCHGKSCSGLLAFQYPESGYVLDAHDRLLNPALAHPVWPTQLMESVGNLILAIILTLLLRRLRPGQTAALYLTGYGILRFSLEFLRGDHRDYFLELFTPAQVICIFAVPVGAAMFFLLRKRHED